MYDRLCELKRLPPDSVAPQDSRVNPKHAEWESAWPSMRSRVVEPISGTANRRKEILWCCQPWSICGFCQQYLPSARLKCWRWHVAWAVQLLPNPVLVSDLRYDYMYTSYCSNCSLIQLRTWFLKLVFRFLLYTYLKNVQFWDFKDEQLVQVVWNNIYYLVDH